MPKVKKFCKILKYLEQEDSELADAVEDLCLHYLFVPKGYAGITFLHPKDKAYRKAILDAAYGDEPEEAVQMLQSLTIVDYLPNPRDFVLKKEDIPNRLRQRIEVTSADTSSVKLTCGCTLKKASGFKALGTRDNMAVYELTGAQIPLDGPPATFKFAAKRRGRKKGDSKEAKGGYVGSSEEAVKELEAYLDAKEKELAGLQGKEALKAVAVPVLSWLRCVQKNAPGVLPELKAKLALTSNPVAAMVTVMNDVVKDDPIAMGNLFSEWAKSNLTVSDNVMKDIQNIVDKCPGAKLDKAQMEAAKAQLEEATMRGASAAVRSVVGGLYGGDAKRVYGNLEVLNNADLAVLQGGDDELGEVFAGVIGAGRDSYKARRSSTSGGSCAMGGMVGPASLYMGGGMMACSDRMFGGKSEGSKDAAEMLDPERGDDETRYDVGGMVDDALDVKIAGDLSVSEAKELLKGL